jgi:micrococcal nuclease
MLQTKNWYLKTVKFSKNIGNSVKHLLLSSFFAFSSTVFAVQITYFYDGDTVKIKDGTGEYKLRLTDIDAPERNQTYGQKSRRALMNFCKNAEVKVQLISMDKYFRYLGKMQCNGNDVSGLMVQNGHAWVNTYYQHDAILIADFQTAQQKKLGLWNAEKPTPPWIWRKKYTHKHN